MISEVLSVRGAIGGFAISLLVFGLAPGLVLALIVRLIPDLDRRAELQAELYAVQRWERPYWVLEQLEVAIRVGLFPRAMWRWSRHVWHRASLQSGLDSHRRCPETFLIPGTDQKDALAPGDLVKLMWSVRRYPGERMWVRITERRGDRLVGTLECWPVFVFMDPGTKVRFKIDDIIDCRFAARERESLSPLCCGPVVGDSAGCLSSQFRSAEPSPTRSVLTAPGRVYP